MKTYAVRCPKCARKAEATMVEAGVKGTYREATERLVASRISCAECGHVKDTPAAPTDDYQLWYVTALRGHRLWAVNDEQLEFLMDWLSGNLNKAGLSVAARAYVEALPKWLLAHRKEAIQSLEKMRTRG
jgi:hypothetical protein